MTLIDGEFYMATPPTASIMKCGNITVNNTRKFNWLQRKMWKTLLGFEIQNTEVHHE